MTVDISCIRSKVITLVVITFMAPWHVVAALKDYPFRVSSVKAGHHHELIAQNDGPVTISVRVAISGDNLGSDVSWPRTAVIPRYSSQKLGRIHASTQGRSYRFTFTWSHHFGNALAVHDSGTRYRLPYEDGKTFTIGQAFGGPITTHNSPESLYAVDFTLPEGTPIVAARGGIVADVTLDYHRGGPDPRLLGQANSVTILHDDGTVAEYAHLSPQPAPVRRGQVVMPGDHLGYSGNTGFSSGPHLHFVVSRPTATTDGKLSQHSLPVEFYIDNPPIIFSPRWQMRAAANYGEHGRVITERTRVAKLPVIATPNAPVAAIESRKEPTPVTRSPLARLPAWAWIVLIAVLALCFLQSARKRRISRLAERIEPVIRRK